MSESKFVDACLQGDALLDEIDDYVDKWHESDSDEELDTFLGFTESEYDLWLNQGDSIIRNILFARKNDVAIAETQSLSAAARASSKQEAEKILSWLKNTGRLKD